LVTWPSAPDARAPALIDSVIRSQLPRIRRRLRALFPEYLDLDELEQQVLLNVLHGLRGYRGEGSLHAWVDRITLRVGFKHARRVRARRRTEQALFEHLFETEARPHSELYFARCQLEGLLASLPAKQERALLLRHVLGLELTEVAADQGVSRETARSRLRLAMQKLRQRARLTHRRARG
jgi:RNA polymerase sigma-70 factor (ECF subfamily)